MKISQIVRSLPAVPLLVLAFSCLILPLLVLTYTAFSTPDGLGITNFVDVFSNASDRSAITNSLQFAMWQTILCVGLGTPIALALLSLTGRARAWVLSLVNVASNIGGPSLAFGFLLLIGSNGMLTILWSTIFEPTEMPTLGSMVGLNIIMLYAHLPLYIMLTLPSYAVLRHEWREAARMSGASTWRYWRSVGIPVLAPFLTSNALQVFMWSMGAYSVPYVVTQSPSSVSLLAVEIGRGIEGAVFGFEKPATLAVLLMAQAFALILMYRTAQRRGERIIA